MGDEETTAAVFPLSFRFSTSLSLLPADSGVATETKPMIRGEKEEEASMASYETREKER